jgi:hypothetical protein
MPRGDGTGPQARGRGQGRRMGRGAGQGRGGGFGLGPGGDCICPDCGTKIAHEMGIPCFRQTCPKCGAAMTRQ